MSGSATGIWGMCSNANPQTESLNGEAGLLWRTVMPYWVRDLTPFGLPRRSELHGRSKLEPPSSSFIERGHD